VRGDPQEFVLLGAWNRWSNIFAAPPGWLVRKSMCLAKFYRIGELSTQHTGDFCVMTFIDSVDFNKARKSAEKLNKTLGARQPCLLSS
jgi:hypothetical protein